jgi:hypothetical protein
MSVPVDLSGLEAELERFGWRAYLMTVGQDRRPHAVSVQVRYADRHLVVAAGRTSLSNAGANPDVALLWTPVDDTGFSLIVDGRAEATDGELVVAPTKSVLHRSAAGPDGAASSECVSVLRTEPAVRS